MMKEEDDDDDDDRTPAKIAVVDINMGKKIREITAGPETEGIEFSKDGKQIIVTNEADNTVTVHDFNSGDLIKTFQAEPYGLRPSTISLGGSSEPSATDSNESILSDCMSARSNISVLILVLSSFALPKLIACSAR